MESTTPPGRHKVAPENQHGDVDADGEIVDLADMLRRRACTDGACARLAAAICPESTIDVDEHLTCLVYELERCRR